MDEQLTRCIDADGNAETVWVCSRSPQDCRIAELESLLRASEARERELRAIPPIPEDIHEAAFHRAAIKRSHETGETFQVALLTIERDSARNGRETYRVAHAGAIERIYGAEERAQLCEELRASALHERDAALDQVAILRDVIDDFFNYEGGSVDPRQDDYLMNRAVDALTDTCAAASQRIEAIRREAVEKLVSSILREPRKAEFVEPWIVAAELAIRAAILGEKADHAD